MIYEIINKLEVNVNTYFYINIKERVVKRVDKNVVESESHDFHEVNNVFVKTASCFN